MTDKVSEDSIILLTKEIEKIKDLSVLTTNEIELLQSDTSKKQLDLNFVYFWSPDIFSSLEIKTKEEYTTQENNLNMD